MIGWEEIAKCDLDRSTITQLWVNKFGLNAAAQGSKVIMSPATQIYLDMKYDSTTKLGLDWAGVVEIKTSYNWDPAELVTGLTEKDILGVEAPLWSETIVTIDDLEYLAFPRLLSVAEIGWSQKDRRNWEDYKFRLGTHGKRLENLEVNFYRSKQVEWR